MKKVLFCPGVTAVFSLSLSGCGVKEIRQQTAFADQVGMISGKVVNSSGQKGDLIVLRFTDEDGVFAFKRMAVN